MSIRHALLALLVEEPKYGLRLREEFEHKTGEVWPLNVGQVYSTLKRLERDGLVEPDGPDDVREKTYRLLPAGRDELNSWLETTPEIDRPDRHDLVMRLLIAATTPGVDVMSLIDIHRRHLLARMQEFTRLKRDSPRDIAFLLIADSEIFRAEADVRWLDSAEEQLARQPDGPLGGQSGVGAADDDADVGLGLRDVAFAQEGGHRHDG